MTVLEETAQQLLKAVQQALRMMRDAKTESDWRDLSARTTYKAWSDAESALVRAERLALTGSEISAPVDAKPEPVLPSLDGPVGKIRVTSDVKELKRIWGKAWAEEHVGKTYDVNDFDQDGWAYTDRAKFPAHVYEVIA